MVYLKGDNNIINITVNEVNSFSLKDFKNKTDYVDGNNNIVNIEFKKPILLGVKDLKYITSYYQKYNSHHGMLEKLTFTNRENETKDLYYLQDAVSPEYKSAYIDEITGITFSESSDYYFYRGIYIKDYLKTSTGLPNEKIIYIPKGDCYYADEIIEYPDMVDPYIEIGEIIFNNYLYSKDLVNSERKIYATNNQYLRYNFLDNKSYIYNIRWNSAKTYREEVNYETELIEDAEKPFPQYIGNRDYPDKVYFAIEQYTNGRLSDDFLNTYKEKLKSTEGDYGWTEDIMKTRIEDKLKEYNDTKEQCETNMDSDSEKSSLITTELKKISDIISTTKEKTNPTYIKKLSDQVTTSHTAFVTEVVTNSNFLIEEKLYNALCLELDQIRSQATIVESDVTKAENDAQLFIDIYKSEYDNLATTETTQKKVISDSKDTLNKDISDTKEEDKLQFSYLSTLYNNTYSANLKASNSNISLNDDDAASISAIISQLLTLSKTEDITKDTVSAAETQVKNFISIYDTVSTSLDTNLKSKKDIINGEIEKIEDLIGTTSEKLTPLYITNLLQQILDSEVELTNKSLNMQVVIKNGSNLVIQRFIDELAKLTQETSILEGTVAEAEYYANSFIFAYTITKNLLVEDYETNEKEKKVAEQNYATLYTEYTTTELIKTLCEQAETAYATFLSENYNKEEES